MSTVTDRLALAFDLDDLVEASRLARQLRPWFSVAKVGLELFSAAGPEAVITMRRLGFRVFLDVKLHDIPTTVGRSARVLGSLGVDLLTLHTAGGADMTRAGVEGLRDGAAAAGLPDPIALGVTVLTSDPRGTPGLVAERAELGRAAGCGGLVCSVGDLHEARRAAPGLLIVTPGIRFDGADTHDQARAATPEAALAAGSDLLVIGRAITAAADPPAAARALVTRLG